MKIDKNNRAAPSTITNKITSELLSSPNSKHQTIPTNAATPNELSMWISVIAVVK